MGRGERAAEEDGEWRAEEEDEEWGGEHVWQWRTRRGETVVEDWEGRVEWVVVGDGEARGERAVVGDGEGTAGGGGQGEELGQCGKGRGERAASSGPVALPLATEWTTPAAGPLAMNKELFHNI